MNAEAVTTVMPRRGELLPAPQAARPRETLVLGCVICRSPHHGRLACPMADAEEKTGGTR